jgi:UDP-N-acetylglucosamine:LPS N-acetylglucosamine transferase
LVSAGAAARLDQAEATGEKLAALVVRLLRDPMLFEDMRIRLLQWHAPRAANVIADQIVASMNSKHRAANFQSGISQAFEPAGVPGL